MYCSPITTKMVVYAAFFLLLAGPGCDQKVATKYDKSVDFNSYKRYGWGENYLLARQLPEDIDRIDRALRDSINRQLQAKGFVLDEKDADFRMGFPFSRYLVG